jgi:2-polyprenyl-3-methyl-5-hydroxy-6-metoxy-1,4-benzoquinol methylase
MAVIRTSGEPLLTFYKEKGPTGGHFEFESEWQGEDAERINEPSWQARYKYESNLLTEVIKANNFKDILEIGSGPGVLGQMTQEQNPNVNYSFIDRIGAKDVFKKNKYKGTFYVKDLMNSFDTSDLGEYDFIVTNDFLEHIYNPSIIVQNSYKILKKDGMMFVSVPNWRMGHTFVYRGLFDYDNFIYFMYAHGFQASQVWKSPLKCNNQPKLSSEDSMDDDLIDSWNIYLCFTKI